jgi:hypothetical protein
LELYDNADQNDIVSDEINARKAFMFFNDQQLKREGEETFDDKVNRVIRQLDDLKILVKLRENDKKEESKGEDKINILQEIDDLKEKADGLINPISKNEEILSKSVLKPISQAIQKISKDSEESSENIVYELMYNKDSKNVIIAAKISELQKRVNTIQKQIGNWDSLKSSKYGTLSELLALTQDKLKIMNSKEYEKMSKNVRKVFDNVLNAQESKEIKEFMFDSSPVSQLKEIVATDKEESDLVENDIERLEGLRRVHEESAQVFNRLKELRDMEHFTTSFR